MVPGFMVNIMSVSERIKLAMTSLLYVLILMGGLGIVLTVLAVGWVFVAFYIYKKKEEEILEKRRKNTIHMSSIDN